MYACKGVMLEALIAHLASRGGRLLLRDYTQRIADDLAAEMLAHLHCEISERTKTVSLCTLAIVAQLWFECIFGCSCKRTRYWPMCMRAWRLRLLWICVWRCCSKTYSEPPNEERRQIPVRSLPLPSPHLVLRLR